MAGPTARHRSREGARRILAYIQAGIADGSLVPGMRLPTERELSRRFGMPRNAVRKTLAEFEAGGTITRHVGRGTFIAGPAVERDISSASIAHTSPGELMDCLLYTSPSPRDKRQSRMPSSA